MLQILLVRIKSQVSPELREESYTKTWLSAGECHERPPEAPVCPVFPSGFLILGVNPLASLEFPVTGLTHSTFLSPRTPLISFRHYLAFKNLSHMIYRDFACLFTQHVFINHLLYESYIKNGICKNNESKQRQKQSKILHSQGLFSELHAFGLPICLPWLEMNVNQWAVVIHPGVLQHVQRRVWCSQGHGQRPRSGVNLPKTCLFLIVLNEQENAFISPFWHNINWVRLS